MVEKDNEDEYEVSINELKGLTDKVLEKLNYQDQNERNIISDTLLYAQLRGNSQGVVKLITGGVPKRNDQIEDSFSFGRLTECRWLVCEERVIGDEPVPVFLLVGVFMDWEAAL